MGCHLPATYIDAGLHFEKIWAEAVLEGQGDQYRLSELLSLLSPRLEEASVAIAFEIEKLIAQINSEINPSKVFLSGMRFCALAINP